MVDRSGTGISASTLHQWMKKGRRDVRNGHNTAWTVFVGAWDKLYTGNNNNEKK